MLSSLGSAGVALEQEAVHLHHAKDPLHVRRESALPLGVPTQERVDAPIAVGGQVSDERLDGSQKSGIGQRRPPPPSRRGCREERCGRETPRAEATALTGRPPATRSRARAAF